MKTREINPVAQITASVVIAGGLFLGIAATVQALVMPIERTYAQVTAKAEGSDMASQNKQLAEVKQASRQS
ncbi:hypothetical protein [Parachitinimonas caeni]|uniref:Uncharacterized protein n=1 Tax=Parachitinimonas caeni TaxID=3031301 RepID=A0ABT7DVU4_9NEIS|nr:hypothetical protein [Parachitinimonas caeni]MDK2123969.1 hypothetical protein [Parachitinimonas caeni]